MTTKNLKSLRLASKCQVSSERHEWQKFPIQSSLELIFCCCENLSRQNRSNIKWLPKVTRNYFKFLHPNRILDLLLHTWGGGGGHKLHEIIKRNYVLFSLAKIWPFGTSKKSVSAYSEQETLPWVWLLSICIVRQCTG